MSYKKRLERAFTKAPFLPLTKNTKYVFFSDCHRGIGNTNDNFLPNSNNYYAALQYYYQYGFCYIEAGDGDELWENRRLLQIIEIHEDIFAQLCQFHKAGRLYMLYGNHDMQKKKCGPLFEEFPCYEGIILKAEFPIQNQQNPMDNNPFRGLYITHGHQADLLNSVFWRLSRFLVRYLWTPLERFGVLDPTSAAKNNIKKDKLEKKYIAYAKEENCLLLTGHTHRPTLGNKLSPYYNCGSCVHPKCITCIELCGYQISLVKWYSSTQKSEHFGNIYRECPPTFPVYIKREVIVTDNLLS